jgi:iron(III) transport system substrate-binding protein
MRGTSATAAPLRSVLAALALAASPSWAAAPPRTPSRTVAAARMEGKVVVWSATDRAIVGPLLADFAELHPGIAVDYREMVSGELHERFTRGAAAGRVEADVLWSPAMDLQIKLANDGYAAAYDSPEAEGLAPWAVWRDEAFATTLEPFVFVHDERVLPAGEVPQSHADLVRLLDAYPSRFQGSFATYDPERSGVGYLLLTQDSRIDPGFGEALRAYGRAGIRLHETTGAMLDDVRTGKALLAFNVIGSYALRARRSSPHLGVVFPRDYVLAMSRIAIIPRGAPHPSAAKVFLDYLLSARGQDVLANRCALFSIRNDVEGETTAVALSRSLGARLKPIHVGPSLLVFLDPSKRDAYLRRWRAAFAER